jgi:SAM-dependent methyltransferase
MAAPTLTEHPFDESYFVGGSKSNYADYREVEPAIDKGFMPVVRRYADYAGRGKAQRSCLDIGCAVGFYVERLAALGWDAHGVDISEWAIAEGRRRGVRNLEAGTVDELPFADETFDLVTSIDVIEHVEPATARAMVSETYRVLKPGGLAFVATPNFLTNAYWNVFTPGFVDADKTHVNYQSVESLRGLFSDFSQCHLYGDTPFVDQFHAFERSEAFTARVFRVPRVREVARHVAWKLLGRSVEYSSYLHAVAIKGE